MLVFNPNLMTGTNSHQFCLLEANTLNMFKMELFTRPTVLLDCGQFELVNSCLLPNYLARVPKNTLLKVVCKSVVTMVGTE